MQALRAGFVAFAVSLAVLYIAEWIFHKITKNPNRSYRWGVVVFALLIGVYEYISNLGV